MTRHILPLTVVAVLALSACGKSQPEVVGGVPDPMQDKLTNKVALPPMVKASHTYRCKDNSLVYVDFMSDDLSANIHTDKTPTPTALKADAKGGAFKADGYSVSGSGNDVAIAMPGKGSQDCTG